MRRIAFAINGTRRWKVNRNREEALIEQVAGMREEQDSDAWHDML